MITLDAWDGESAQIIPLSAGTWQIRVAGLIPGQTVEVSEGRSETPIIVNPGPPGLPVSVTITMKPTLASGGEPGTLQYDPGPACPVITHLSGIAAAELTLKSTVSGAQPRPPINLLDRASGAAIALPAGYYAATVKLTKDTGEKAVKTQAVHIYRGMTTVLGDFGFTPEDFTAYTFDDIVALTAYLSAAPENGPETPYLVKLKGLDLDHDLAGEENFSDGNPPLPRGRDLLYRLYESFQGKYVTLDLSAYTNIPSTESNVNYGYAGLRPDRDRLVGLILSPSAASIGDFAFYYCTSLTSIDLPDSLESIGQGAFFGAGLTELVLSESLISIGTSAFNTRENNELTSVGLTSVDFSACRNLTSIGYSAFGFNAGLTSVDLSSCTSLEILDGAIFQECTGLTSVTLPDSLRTIRGAVFKGCTSLESITLPDSLTAIGNSVFINCTSLPSIDLPAALATIGTNTFRGCTSLPSVDLPASVTNIGNNAFYGDASLTEVISRADVPPALGGTGVFTGCTSLTAIKVPAASVDAYRAAPRWSAYAAIITAL